MGMTKMIEIDGKQVPFKASAAIPRIYRIKFHRDIYKDLDALGKAVGNGDEVSSHLDMFSLEMFENIAYIMAKHADPSPYRMRDLSLIMNPGCQISWQALLVELNRAGALWQRQLME